MRDEFMAGWMGEQELIGAPSVMVLFGGTGDLAKRKIYPALYHLNRKGLLPKSFSVIAIGRRPMNDGTYRKYLHSFMGEELGMTIRREVWETLSPRIHYLPFQFEDPSGYQRLQEVIQDQEGILQTKNRLYYLAVAPEYFSIIVGHLKRLDMVNPEGGWKRLVIEKPFGRDLASARRLNGAIIEVFPENSIYRIDHYLGKQMIQNIMVLRFTNTLFEPLWNGQYIDNVQISSSEELGIETRGTYYDRAGALRDMVQNHMMQLLTLTAMEPPVKLDYSSIVYEKLRVLRSLQEYTHETISHDIVRGQYTQGTINGQRVRGYRQEEGVDPDSNTETFVAMKLALENYRWAGVPFYLRTGKRMPTKSTEIIVEFKKPPEVLFFKDFKLHPNLLVIRIQPKEGVFLRFNAKKPGMVNQIIPVDMDYYQNCDIYGNCPDAYERLILDVMRGDPTLFASWDEVEYSWRIVDNIALAWCKNPESRVIPYPAGHYGPKEADELLARDHREWWNI